VVRFPATARLDAETFLLSRLAASHLRHGGASRGREPLYEVLRRSIRASFGTVSTPRAASAATRRARRRIVEEAKEILTARLGDAVSLDDVARAVCTSPYHLARIFRAATGFSVHGYLAQLRLRSGLDRIVGGTSGSGRIGETGATLGYGSPSHFTASFRRSFGVAPTGLLAASS
jgi:AraC-like DNA-binding protein